MQEFEAFNLMAIGCQFEDKDEATWSAFERTRPRCMQVRAWPPCEKAVDTGWTQGRDEERVPGTSPCKGPSYIAVDHPAMGGTKHNDMDRYVEKIALEDDLSIENKKQDYLAYAKMFTQIVLENGFYIP
eukprot:gene3881-15182_t